MPEIRRKRKLKPKISRMTYAEMRDKLSETKHRLAKRIYGAKDKDIQKTRIGHYEKMIVNLEGKHRTGEIKNISSKEFEAFMGTYHDVQLLCDVYDEFKEREDDVKFDDALKQIVESTPQSKDEKNSKARDTLFELRLAGMFGDKNISFEHEDFVASVEGKNVVIEYKRVKSVEKRTIQRNYRQACKQLTTKLNGSKIDAGIVAFQIDKPINNGNKILLASGTEGLEAVAGRHVGDFLRTNRDVFIKNVDTRIIGVIALFVGPAIADREKMPFYIVQVGANNLAISFESIAGNGKHYIDPSFALFNDVVEMVAPR
jgi:hypothetical protein